LTLITVAANRDFIVQLSDRRLTSDGNVFTEDETKVIYIQTPTFQGVMGYTGLATIYRQPTNQVLMDLMMTALEDTELDIDAAMRRFSQLLTETWMERRVQRAGKANTRLSVILTGFRLSGQTEYSGPLQCFITNFQEWGVGDHALPWPEFTILFRSPRGDWPTTVQRIGAHQALSLDEAEKLRERLAEGIPPTAVRDSMLDLLPSQSAAYPTIGTRANVVIIRPHQEPEGSYHAFNEVRAIQMFDQVIATSPKEIVIISRMTVKQISEGEGFITEIPRRQPCSCMSGLPYRRCHGKRSSTAKGIIFPAKNDGG
jgi:hypothetical protein